MRVRVGEQATVDHEHGSDRRCRGVAGRRPIEPAAQYLEQGQRRVVERDHDGAAHAVVAPHGLDQVRALHAGIPIVARLVRIALPHRLHVQPRPQVVAEHSVYLRPPVGAVRESGQHGEPRRAGILRRSADAVEDVKRVWGRAAASCSVSTRAESGS